MKTKIEELEVGDKILVKFGIDYVRAVVIGITTTNIRVIRVLGTSVTDALHDRDKWSHTGQTLAKTIKDWISSWGCDQS